ncbi:MAG: hypothetical protein KAI53_04900 [Candidatus Aenigmarchaeota archaeon]|nr:hypothetical protein [Candidatus Aenigmarchaeota archaeon]
MKCGYHEISMQPRPKGRGLFGSVSSPERIKDSLDPKNSSHFFGSPTVNFDLKDGVSTVVDDMFYELPRPQIDKLAPFSLNPLFYEKEMAERTGGVDSSSL